MTSMISVKKAGRKGHEDKRAEKLERIVSAKARKFENALIK